MRYLKEATRSLGFILRKFVKKTCSAFDTRELPKEVNARTRRKAAASAKGKDWIKKQKKRIQSRQRGRGPVIENYSISPRTSFTQWESTIGPF